MAVSEASKQSPNRNAVQSYPAARLATGDWLKNGALAAAVSIVLVLAAQVVALRIWPESAAFAPLDNLGRSALFTLVPAAGATLVFAWLAARRKQPVRDFVAISAVLLLLSMIPDYLLPVEHRTFTASTIAAFLHLVAATAIVGVLVCRYQKRSAA